MNKVLNKNSKISKYIDRFIYRLFIGFIVLLSICLLDKFNKIEIIDYQNKLKENIKILNVVSSINGKLNIINLGKGEEITVSSEYSNILVTDERTKIVTSTYEGIRNYNAGVVIKIVNDNTYTVFIESIDGEIYEYSNIDNINVHIYQYIKSNEIIGQSDSHYYINRVSD